jgi:asparagine synthase (glutamine-hydrolysing)
MCGICGIVDFVEKPSSEKIRAMNRTMAHRGPDAQGLVSYDNCALGHTRLSIIDLSRSADQPMVNPMDNSALVFNGEIYNFLELRESLESKGRRFRTDSDTEVVLAMYMEFGEGMLQYLNGMFSLAIWDPSRSSLFLARDRMGKKPLYYLSHGGSITFASELNALRKGVSYSLSIMPQAIFEYFLYDFIPAPHTPFTGVFKLPPATAARFDSTGLKSWTYWSPPCPETGKDYYHTRRELNSLLMDSTGKRLISDVPLGSFLSGGLDSTLVSSLMTRQSRSKVRTFSIAFPGATHDESKWSRLAADSLGTDHREFPCSYQVPETLEKMIPNFGAPFGDCSAIPTWHLCRHTRERVTVALSGDGGDELFGGYDRYLARRLQLLYDHLPAPVRERFIEPIVESAAETTDYYGTSLIKKLKLFIRAAGRLRENRLALIPRTFTISQVRELLGSDYSPDSDPTIEVARQWTGLDPVSRMMFTDMQTYMAEDILTKVDRMSMAHSLEVRSPLLDYRVVELACSSPLGFKMKGTVLKRILKDVAKDYVPPQILNRTKYGFQVPMGQWLKSELKGWAGSSLFDSGNSHLNKKALERLWDEHQRGACDHGLRIWSALVFIHWADWLRLH